MRIRSLLQRWSSWRARIASFSLRAIDRVLSTYAFFTNCCVIVEPPWTNCLCWTSAQKARAMALKSTPSCSQKRRSSTATIACFMIGAISSEDTITRFSDPRSTASTRLPLRS